MKCEELRRFVRGWAKLGLGCLTFCAAVVGFAAETISITATPRYPWNGKVDLKFTIDGTSGTKYDTSFTAKDVAGGTNLTMKTLYKSNGTAANVAKEQLLPGTYNWVWDATADLGEGTVLEKVVVEGEVLAHEHLYMVIDLSGGSSAKSYPVSYLDAVPSGGWGTTYKGNKLVLRKVRKGSNSVAGSMSTDMWVGVFEVTQLQYKNVMNKTPSTYAGDYRPIEHAGYFACEQFLTKLSSRTGKSFRMPTRDEWRYACRAGSTAKPFSATKETSRCKESASDGKGGYSTYHTVVGSYKANGWGLYDMLGNVFEWTSTGLSGSESYYIAYPSGGSYAESLPNDDTRSERGSMYGGDENEGFRAFAIAE